MKLPSILTLARLAIACAVPTFAEQKDTSDFGIVQQRDLLGVAGALGVFGDLSGKLDDAYNNRDAAAAAALFTEDAVFVTPDGMVFGRQAIAFLRKKKLRLSGSSAEGATLKKPS